MRDENLYIVKRKKKLILVLVVISSRGTNGKEPKATSFSGSRHLSTEPEPTVTAEDYISQLNSHLARGNHYNLFFFS